ATALHHYRGLNSDFLFHYGDVGSRGVSRWLDLSSKFERALTPLVGLLGLAGASLDARIAQVSIGFEMLGYDLLIEAGASKTKAKDAAFVGQVGAVAEAVEGVLPFSASEFSDRLRRTYVSVKHADKARSDPLEMYLAYRQSIQIFRSWVALRLGVPKARLKTALERDPITQHIHQISRELEQGRIPALR
ncbi:HEPN domain-containing protein, partial [Cellulosimicrobium composti]|uniref:HEPN domain-containing protein n=1 Tax=Cellulosimicrobium composti TaxID=2672572 RepID=UPI0018ACC49F